MKLQEAIEHAEQKAQDLNCSCRADHWQLAQWLKELKVRREVDKRPTLRRILSTEKEEHNNDI